MFTIRSSYNTLLDQDTGNSSNRSNNSIDITPGICDYIPQGYFAKPFFSIFIQGNNIKQIINHILWNQYYEKTILKEIYMQLNLQSNQVDIYKNTTLFKENTSIIYLKVETKVFNLKEKLSYEFHKELEQILIDSKSLTIQKICNEGKWKKIIIDFGPYKLKSQYDITFICSDAKNIFQIGTIQQEKIPIKKQRRNSTSNKNLATAKKSQQSTNKQKLEKTKTKIVTEILQNSSVKQKKFTDQNKSSRKVSNFPKNSAQSQISMKKSSKISQNSSQKFDILNQVNFNTTSKLQKNQFQNTNFIDDISLASLDLKRKQKIKTKQNHIVQNQNYLPLHSGLLNRMSQSTKQNSVLSQILSKKQQTICQQKKKIDQIEYKNTKQMQQLKMKHIKQTQMFKDQISTILNEYNKKYQNKQLQSKALKDQLDSLNKIIYQNKVFTAELQVKTKSQQEQLQVCKRQLAKQRQKLHIIQKQYQVYQLSAKQQQCKLQNQRNDQKAQKQKYFKKYSALSKKVKVLIQEDQSILMQ